MEVEELKSRWYKTKINQHGDVSKFRKLAFQNNVSQEGLRSITWKIFLQTLPNLDPTTWPKTIKTSRDRYAELRYRLIDAPKAAIAQGQSKSDYTKINPLAPDNDNPWTQYFKDSELRKVILQDVERTFPDLELFRDAAIQLLMTDVLFVYCKLNAINSYRQGMHELLAPLVYVLKMDSRNPDISNPTGSFFASPEGKALWNTVDPRFIEHDAFVMFEQLMSSACAWFEAPSPDEAARLARAHRARNQTKLIRSLNYPPKSSTPILALCYRLYYTRLATCDPPLFAHLERLEIEPQLFGLRWFRLLFTREFPFAMALQLWDGMLAFSSDLELAEFVALAMLIYLRDQMIDQDYSTTLQRLMRFPSLKSISTLLKQASMLARQPETSIGYQVAAENYKNKGIHISMLPPFPVEEESNKTGRARTNSASQINTNSSLYASRKHASSTSSLTPASDKPTRVNTTPQSKPVNTPITDKKVQASPKNIPPHEPKQPKISLNQVADLDANIKSGLEICLQLIESENFSDRSGEAYSTVIGGIQSIISTIQARVEVLKGKPFDGVWHFNFPTSKLAAMVDKEHWEFVSKSESELDTTEPMKSEEPPTNVSEDQPLVEDIPISVPNPDSESTIPDPVVEPEPTSTNIPDIVPSEIPLPASPIEVEKTLDSSQSKKSQSPKTTEKIPVSSQPKKLENTEQKKASVVEPTQPSTEKKPTSNSSSKKLKEVRQQYDWIFGSPEQQAKVYSKPNPVLLRSSSSPNELASDLSKNPLGILPKRPPPPKLNNKSDSFINPLERDVVFRSNQSIKSNASVKSYFDEPKSQSEEPFKKDNEETHYNPIDTELLEDSESWSSSIEPVIPISLPKDLHSGFTEEFDTVPSYSVPLTFPTPQPDKSHPEEFFDNPW